MRALPRLLCRRFASSASQTVDRFAMLGVEVREIVAETTTPERTHRSPPLPPQRRFDLDTTDLHASYKALMVRALRACLTRASTT